MLVEVVAEMGFGGGQTLASVVSVRVNNTDFRDDGFGPGDARELVALLQGVRVGFVEPSGGMYDRIGLEWTKQSTPRREAFFVEFADVVVPALGEPRVAKVFVTGGLRSAGAMVKATVGVAG